MRPIALLLLALSLTAAELEQITLTDGRRLIGYYDEAAGKIVLDGPTRAILPIRPDQVASRSPYVRSPEAEQAKKEEGQAKPAEPAKPRAQESTANAALKSAVTSAMELRDKAVVMEFDALVAWLSAQDLEHKVIPPVSADPRKSELDAAKQIKAENFSRDNKRKALEKARRCQTLDEKEEFVRLARGLARGIAPEISPARQKELDAINAANSR